MTQLEKRAERFIQWMIDARATVQPHDTYLAGLKEGVGMAIEAIDDIACGLTPAQKEGWLAARTAVKDLLKQPRHATEA